MLQRERDRPLVYLAGPLFSEAELEFNARLAQSLEVSVDVYLPQRDGSKYVDLASLGISPGAAARTIFDRDVAAIREASALILVMDGRVVDEGAAFELGLAYALGKVCVGLQTDPRRLLPLGNNPMIEIPLQAIFETRSEIEIWARRFAATHRVASDGQ